MIKQHRRTKPLRRRHRPEDALFLFGHITGGNLRPQTVRGTELVVLVGGAAVTADFARSSGATYGADAFEAVRLLDTLMPSVNDKA